MNYKEMYLELFRATEKAINILIEAQQKCEEMYISQDDGTTPFPIEKIIPRSDD